MPDIQKHITSTYLNLRFGMSALAFFLPIGLLLGVIFSQNVNMQGSISAFYHSPMRNLLVGVLVAVGAFLYLYKGFSVRENVALNAAGILVIGVAFLPTFIPEAILETKPWPSYLPTEPYTSPYLHGVCAVLFFISIAFACIKCGEETLELIDDEQKREMYRERYQRIGKLMVVMPILAVIVTFVLNRFYLVFIVEVIAIWIFAYYWLLKSQELKQQSEPVEKILMYSEDAIAISGKRKDVKNIE